MTSDLVLRDFQRRAWKLVNVYGRYALYFPVGSGKTLSGLAVLAEQISRGNDRWLVVAPISVVPGWLGAAARWFPEMRIWSPAKVYGKRDHLATLARWGVTDYDPRAAETVCFRKAQVIVLNKHIIIPRKIGTDARGHAIREDRGWARANYDGLIVDESDIFGDPKSLVTKTFLKIAGRVNKLVLLSGLPSPKNGLDLWAQGYALGCWRDKYFAFCQRHGVQDHFRAWSVREDGAEEILRLLKTRAWFLTDISSLGIPESQKIIRWYRSSDARVPALGRSVSGVAAVVAAAFKGLGTRYEKSRQITAGFLRLRAPDGVNHVTELHGDRLQALDELLDELGTEPAIIWYMHTWIRDKAFSNLSKRGSTVTFAGDGVGAREQAQRWADFCAGKYQFFIAHPLSVGKGTDGAQALCSVAIWAENTNSYRDWHQAEGRLVRSGQTKPVRNFCLAEEASIDQQLLDCVEQKKEWADYVRENLENTGN